jgi:transcriptional regulator
MYSLAYFKENDLARVKEFMRAYPFVILAGNAGAGIPVATHVPVLINEAAGELKLLGHIMKKTDHHHAFLQNPQVLAIFNGPHAYVSASWYSNPRQASTWNYMTVHARGQLRFLGEGELAQVLEQLTEKFEGRESSPSLYPSLSAEYLQRLTPAIIAFEIAVDSIENVFKLSQNRDVQSFENIIEHLRERGSDDAKKLAAEMEVRKSELFSATGPMQRP